MKKLLFSILAFISFINIAFAQNAVELQQKGQVFIRTGDYANAIVTLNRSAKLAPTDISIIKDLALAHYYQKDFTKALDIITPALDSKNADDQCYQIAGLIYQQQEKVSASEKMYKKGIKKFPTSGALYNELGELQYRGKNYNAIKTWEAGIKQDPNYSKNYYNAAKYYFFTLDKVWSLIYGEMYINMDVQGPKVAETKQMLFDGYKKLFADASLEQNNKDKNVFVKLYLAEMNKQAAMGNTGVNADMLFMVRTRFIADWFGNTTNPPNRLFTYHQQLLKEGMFEAYNQWLFGAVENKSTYDNWVKTHAEDNTAFLNLQKARIFKITAPQNFK